MKEFLGQICGISVMIAALKLLVPAGRFEKILKYSLGLFFILSIIGGLKKFDFTLPEISYEITEESNTSLTLAPLEISIKNILEKNGIKVKEIYFDTNITENSGIQINKVIIELKEGEKSKAAETVKSQTGLEVMVK